MQDQTARSVQSDLDVYRLQQPMFSLSAEGLMNFPQG